VHIFYETAGTCGAFFCAYVSLINGKAYAAIITPPCYFFAAIAWWFLELPVPVQVVEPILTVASGIRVFFITLKTSISGFFTSYYEGGLIVLLDPRFQWLFFGYTIPLVMHRYIENGVASVYAKLVLHESAYASFIVGGSNFGELCGALFVFMNLRLLKTPLPCVRWDALVLNLTWLYYNAVNQDTVSTSNNPYVNAGNVAGLMALIMFFISSGWAAGDVQMAAYIQSAMPTLPASTNTVTPNPLASVMCFLYTSYIVIYAIISPLIGFWLDGYTTRSLEAGANKSKILEEQQQDYFYWIAGVFFSLVSILIFANTFTPKNSWKLNPDRPAD